MSWADFRLSMGGGEQSDVPSSVVARKKDDAVVMARYEEGNDVILEVLKTKSI